LHPDEVDEDSLRALMDMRSGPQAWIVSVDPDQPNWPAVSSVLASDGSMTSSPLYDMLPKLSNELLTHVGRYLPKSGMEPS
jgi:hypothetical protein